MALEAGARLLLDRESAERVLYLGDDDALDRVVVDWASRLVGKDPTDAGLWMRAAKLCAHADPPGIEHFVAAERQRSRLRALQSLPHTGGKTVEVLGGRLAVLVHDRDQLVEEDIVPATLLVFGNGAAAGVRKVGKRMFVTPGPLAPDGGIALLADGPEGIGFAVFDRAGARVRDEIVVPAKAAQLRVQGEPGG